MSKAHVYKRDHINTDEIIPARYLNTDDRAELSKHCLEDLDPGFVKKVKKGDIIVAGEDFGCGSSREHAVWAIRSAGVQTVIAKSFARIFYRNAINNGFYVIELPKQIEKINDGDELEIDFKAGLIKNKTAGINIKFNPLPDFALEIIRDGGLLNHIKKPYRRKPVKKNILLLCVFVAIAVSIAGCKQRPIPDALSEKINVKCAIYFNRIADASSSGVITSVSGKLVKVTSEWIVIEAGESNIKEAHGPLRWVPRNAVLYIETE